jgi:hypothetical protein
VLDGCHYCRLLCRGEEAQYFDLAIGPRKFFSATWQSEFVEILVIEELGEW